MFVKEGEIFNQSKLDKDIKKLNESALFEEIKTNDIEIKTLDIEIRTSEENAVKSDNNFINTVSKSGVSYKVRISEDKEIKLKEDTDSVVISLRVKKLTPVKNYYLGNVTFVGNKTISDAELRNTFNLRKNSYFDIKTFIENIRAFNKTERFKPIVENDLHIELGSEGKQDDKFSEQVNLTIQIRELNRKP